MSIASPWWLVLGALVVAVLIAGTVVSSRRRRTALSAAGVAADTRRARLALGLWLSIAGVGVLAVAMAGPAASVPVSRAAGTVIIAMDVSNSMSATDVAPSRLEAAKKAAAAFVQAQPSSVDIGVVAFQSGALTTNQPSADHAQAAAAIDRLKVSGGTSLASAILTSLSAITGKPVAIGKDGTVPDLGYWGSATIVLFSDGGDEGNGDATVAAATAAQTAGVHIETVGVGTTAGTTVEVDGYRIQTALDEDTLTRIAKTTGGSYHPASDTSQLDGIASSINLRLTTHQEPLPLAGAFSGFAIVLLAGGAILTVLRTGRIV
ncbi:VWA domain-containing protein [Jatrophihabitans sp. DSM 45814]